MGHRNQMHQIQVLNLLIGPRDPVLDERECRSNGQHRHDQVSEFIGHELHARHTAKPIHCAGKKGKQGHPDRSQLVGQHTQPSVTNVQSLPLCRAHNVVEQQHQACEAPQRLDIPNFHATIR